MKNCKCSCNCKKSKRFAISESTLKAFYDKDRIRLKIKNYKLRLKNEKLESSTRKAFNFKLRKFERLLNK